MSLLYSDCPDLKLLSRGKVRDLYEVDAHTLLFVATDRISAFDVIMKNPIPNKGKILTQMSSFWFSRLSNIIPHHLITAEISKMPESVQKYRDQLEGRSMLVRRLKVLPIEAIVRGYITGSGWIEYQRSGTICGIELPKGLVESEKIPGRAIFTPSTKADIGEHDENIHPSKVAEIIGQKHADAIADAAVRLYETAAVYALERGIIIADTKFEFGVDEKGDIVLIDEVLTPDSSRFWPSASYTPGRSQNSFDKQFLRDYLKSVGFDMKNGIELPSEVIEQTITKYIEAYQLLTGSELVL